MLDSFQNLHTQLFGELLEPTRFLIAIAALVLVTFIGAVRGALGGNTNPLFWQIIDSIFGKLGTRMDKIGRPKGDLIFRGVILSVFVLGFAFLIGRFVAAISAYYSTWSIVEIIALSVLLSSGSVFAALGRLYRALNDKKVTQGAYFTIARSTRTDLSKNDDYTITRVGMGLALKSFDKAAVAPIMWYLIAGLAGAYIYAALAALNWRFNREGHSSGFGKAIGALEELMGFVPNILSGFLIALAGLLTPTAGMSRAFLGLFKSKGSANYSEGGLPMTAAAFSLNVSLGGPTQDLDNKIIKRGWVGPAKATAQLEAKHLHRVVYMCVMAHLLLLVSLSGAMMFAS